jgi:hypothetical protein
MEIVSMVRALVKLKVLGVIGIYFFIFFITRLFLQQTLLLMVDTSSCLWWSSIADATVGDSRRPKRAVSTTEFLVKIAGFWCRGCSEGLLLALC